jgi:hypothetical protein
MSPQDVEIWKRFILKYGARFDSFDYDLPVGKGEDPGEEYEPFLRKDFIDLTKKRIDAVGYKNGKPTIFEIKPRAGTTALGQLLIYQALFLQSNTQFTSVPLSVVTEFMNTEEQRIYDSHGIKQYIV